jgi:molybdopterin-guanine dinucleotide biosynthesis protein A
MPPSAPCPAAFSGVVLAGGKSSRMGRDKAALPVAGETLLGRQLRRLAGAGCQESLVSVARPDAVLPTLAPGVRVIGDRFPDAGPLAGLEAALALARHELVLALAVDLPAMTAGFLRILLAGAAPGCGVVPVLGDRFEPLVAVYPRRAHAEAELRLQRGERALQPFVRAGIAAGWLRPYPVSAEEARLFTNWNRPKDLPSGLNI